MGTTTVASPILVGPIPMAGSGTYSWTYGSGPEVAFTASGNNGSDSAGLSVSEAPDDMSRFLGLPSSFSNLGCEWLGSATIDGLTGMNACLFHSGDGASWSELGNGSGSISIFDSESNLLATATLIGYVQYTNIIETYLGNTLVGVNADLNIVPTPEPSGALMIGVGAMALLAVQQYRTRRHQLQWDAELDRLGRK